MSTFKYPVYRPSLAGNESRYVNECLATSWISSKGAFVQRFETEFAQYVGAAAATTTSNGTVSLHLALLALDVGPGDEVIVPAFTYVASVNAIRYVGATPVFVEAEHGTWQMNIEDVERRMTPRTKAVMAVHLYGQVCDVERLSALCRAKGVALVEDCAEALGTRQGGTHVGNFGDVGSFSFFGNKTLTTGEGGMLVSRRPEIIARCSHLKSQAVSPEKAYWHDEIGYNYRMTNLCAAIGVAQLERLPAILAEKRRVALAYREHLAALPGLVFHDEVAGTTHSFWMVSVLAPSERARDALRGTLAQHGVETRPAFPAVHHFPMYRAFALGREFPVSDELGARGMNLPSYPDLTDADVATICGVIREAWKGLDAPASPFLPERNRHENQAAR